MSRNLKKSEKVELAKRGEGYILDPKGNPWSLNQDKGKAVKAGYECPLDALIQNLKIQCDDLKDDHIKKAIEVVLSKDVPLDLPSKFENLQIKKPTSGKKTGYHVFISSIKDATIEEKRAQWQSMSDEDKAVYNKKAAEINSSKKESETKKASSKKVPKKRVVDLKSDDEDDEDEE